MRIKLIYILLYSISLIPLKLLYLISNILYVFNNYIFKYRLHIARYNIKSAFPLLSQKKTGKLLYEFYQHFFYIILEIIKSMSFTKNDLINRIQIHNEDIIIRLINTRKPIVLIGAHYQNWEWLLLRIGLIKNIKLSAVYKPLSNTFLDKILFKMRTKFGAKLIPLKKWKYFILDKKNKPYTFLFISDQVPEDKKNGTRINFLNQSTLFHKGAEKTTKLLNAAVLYVEMNKLKKGYYTIEFKEIKSDNITEEYANLLELTIKKDPTAWLWSHNRWKR